MIARQSPDGRLTSYFARDYWFVHDGEHIIYIYKDSVAGYDTDVVGLVAQRFGVGLEWLDEEFARWRESSEYRWNL